MLSGEIRRFGGKRHGMWPGMWPRGRKWLVSHDIQYCPYLTNSFLYGMLVVTHVKGIHGDREWQNPQSHTTPILLPFQKPLLWKDDGNKCAMIQSHGPSMDVLSPGLPIKPGLRASAIPSPSRREWIEWKSTVWHQRFEDHQPKPAQQNRGKKTQQKKLRASY